MRANRGGSWVPAARPAARSWGSLGGHGARGRALGTGPGRALGRRALAPSWCEVPGADAGRERKACIMMGPHSHILARPHGPGEGRQGGLGAGGQNPRSANRPRGQAGAPRPRQSRPPPRAWPRGQAGHRIRPLLISTRPHRPRPSSPGAAVTPAQLAGCAHAVLGARGTSAPPRAPGVLGSSPVLETVTASPAHDGHLLSTSASRGSSGPLQPVHSSWEQGPPEGLAFRQQRGTACSKLLCQAL